MKRPALLILLLPALSCGAPTTSDPATPMVAELGNPPTRGIGPVNQPPSQAAFGDPTYQGGDVLSNVHVIPVFWGSVSSNVSNTVDGFLQTITDSTFIDALGEYFAAKPYLGPIGRGSSIAPIAIVPGNTATSLDNPAIGAEIASQINAGVLPAPDANTLYSIFFAPGISLTNIPGCSDSCSDFCGCHTAVTETIGGASTRFAMAYMPDFSAGLCSFNCGGDEQRAIQIVTSHEVSEAITDPITVGAGWQPEIGDPCAWTDITVTSADTTRSYTHVQANFAPASSTCTLGAGPAPGECQRVSDAFGVAANVTWGFAPPNVQTWWTANGCDTSPLTSTDLCQKASEIYNISANASWGSAPQAVRDWWSNVAQCDSAPLVSESDCQRASDSFGIVHNVTWGAASPDIRDWWTAAGCTTRPHDESACQKVADFYGVTAFSTFGFAPQAVRDWWVTNGCSNASTSSNATLCQNASNLFAIDAGSSFGGAPSEVQDWWTNSGNCNAHPQCQGLSELFGITANVTFGYAPSYVTSWWSNVGGCGTQPLFIADNCQRASDVFSMVSGFTTGYAPDFVQSWWNDNSCTTHPHASRLRQFDNYP